jgi:hypothetical protein
MCTMVQQAVSRDAQGRKALSLTVAAHAATKFGEGQLRQ